LIGQPATITAKPADLQVGCTLQHPVYDVAGVLLLAPGTLIIDKIIEHLIQRRIGDLFFHPSDAGAIIAHVELAPQPEACFASVVDPHFKNFENTGSPVRQKIVALGRVAYDHVQTARVTKTFENTVALIGDLAQSLLGGARHDAEQLTTLATSYETEMTVDTDNVLTTTSDLAHDPQLAERCVRMSVLGMAMGIELGFDERKVRELGVCGLVHDWGMFQLPERLRNPHEPFSRDDWLQYSMHPYRTLKILEQMIGMSEVVLLAASQVHELADGSGYPKGLKKERIHPYAKLLSVADVYISLTSSVRGRPAFLPYDAMKYLLTNIKVGRFDADVVRALLHTLSLFPIGSHVELTDGSSAKVLRRNANEYTKPIVERVQIDSAHSQLVDLVDEGITIRAALPTPHRKEMRIDESLMTEVMWDEPGN
jgi:HD-GYP domain-containing protein (c-di-GMP phosphodiesterase class II)